MNISPSIVFVDFNIDEQRCIEHVDKRLVFFSGLEAFNIATKPPKRAMKCGNYNIALENRDEGNPGVAVKN